MAFISLVFSFFVVLAIGILFIVAGTVVRHKTNHKKLGIVLRTVGYVFLIPIVSLLILFIVDMLV